MNGLHPVLADSLWRALLALLLGLLLAVAGCSWYLARNLPAESVQLEFGPAQLKFMLGRGSTVESKGEPALRMDSFQQEFALLSSGPVSIDASELRVLDLRIDALARPAMVEHSAVFFFRTAQGQGAITRVLITAREQIDLGKLADWQGQVLEVGLLLPQAIAGEARVRGFTLSTESLGKRWSLVWGDWLEREPWSMQSINFLAGGAEVQRLTLVSFVLLWVLLAGACAIGLPGHPPSLLPCLAAILMTGWLAADLRWLGSSLRQVSHALSQPQPLDNDAQLRRGLEPANYAHVQRLKQDILGPEPVRIYLVKDRELQEYFGLRAKYHLLPHNAELFRQAYRPANLRNLDYILFLGEFRPRGSPPGSPVSDAERLEHLRLRRFREVDLELVDVDPAGVLFRVVPKKSRP